MLIIKVQKGDFEMEPGEKEEMDCSGGGSGGA